MSRSERKRPRPDWMCCIARPGGGTYCGHRPEAFEFLLMDLAHAESCLSRSTRIVPCHECVDEARLLATVDKDSG